MYRKSMKLFFYTTLNDISSASNCRDISKQSKRASIFCPLPQLHKISKKPFL